ncbi:DNA-binding protein [Pseudomonas aeruginosa]|uniref:DNA-binding protein n=1 Tax=Pseudomonas aeruginosa TaxID=287 RepID=UPI00099515AC|nr:DNA-binding protein [Pseudomonas aeruginosa]ARH13875.1 DNA-binding protein [Pseudomonas aeruginosa]EIU2641752.1 DNA-binding protein [Pseudomonas aeruginosa]EIU2643323.1 DNA-binding protein [Pseudomonas aeruginosa]EIU2718020.1 DNA-binding protein [Pseudomonas aeruginosa]EIU2863213.1 DNA-binding protein [Pseudomonas aeruginosa]
MAESMANRALQLLDQTSLKELAEVNSKDYVRWQSIKRGRARIGAEELEQLGKIYPQYRWWLMTGEVMPEIGQTSPPYDEANRNLPNQNAG